MKAKLLPTELRSLPQTQLEAFLVCCEQMGYRDAAELLGVPIETLTARLAAARECLGSSSSSSAEDSNSGAKRLMIQSSSGNRPTHTELVAYLDGELSAERKASVDSWINK